MTALSSTTKPAFPAPSPRRTAPWLAAVAGVLAIGLGGCAVEPAVGVSAYDYYGYPYGYSGYYGPASYGYYGPSFYGFYGGGYYGRGYYGRGYYGGGYGRGYYGGGGYHGGGSPFPRPPAIGGFRPPSPPGFGGNRGFGGGGVFRGGFGGRRGGRH